MSDLHTNRNIANILRALPDDKLLEVINNTAQGMVDRFKQESSGENEEVLSRLARNYRSKLARTAWKASQKWCKWDEDGPVLMPDFTRLYYRKGQTEVLLQEFAPQTRLLKFHGSLVSRSGTNEPMEDNEKRKVYSFSLALPYTVFIFKFKDGAFERLYCAFSDRALKRLDEIPLRPYFTNLDTNLMVCHGTGLNKGKLIKGNLAQQSAFILDHFWQSIFSDEWATHFWSARTHFIKNDPRLASISAWEEATEKDPLFVIENVEWQKLGSDNFGDMIVKCFQDTSEEDIQLQDQLYEDIMGALLKEVESKINETAGKVANTVSEIDISKELESHL